jgi:DNA repair protein RecO (recombination protein O)
MQLVQTDGVVLKAHNLAEADRIIVIFTRQSGLIRGVAHGARRLKSKFGGSLEPFTLIALSFSEKEGRDLVTITSTDIKHSLFGLTYRQDLLSTFAYMANIFEKFAPPHEPNERLFRLLVAIAEALGNSECDLDAIKRYFEIWLLKLSGFLPDLRHCFHCNLSLENSGQIYQDPDLRFLCSDCSGGRGLRVPAKAFLLVCDALNFPPAEFAEHFAGVDRNTRDDLTGLNKRYIERVLESDSGALRAAF